MQSKGSIRIKVSGLPKAPVPLSRLGQNFAAVGLAALLAALPAAPVSALPEQAPEHAALRAATQLGKAFSSVARRLSPSVVSIRVESKVQARPTRFPFPFFGFGQAPSARAPQLRRGRGSGVIMRADGYILTNNHVVSGAERVEVELHDKRHLSATVVGVDAATDLAVIKVEASGLRPASFAKRGSVEVGQWAVAIGSPFGLDYSVTAGVVSALGRGGIGTNEIEDYVQTDASINPGNSGGPLVNLRGEVIGINTMILGQGTGIGFAIAAPLANRVGRALIRAGRVERAWLGVSYQALTPAMAARFGVKSTAGALVAAVVPKSPAAEAGLEPGDVIEAVGGRRLEQAQELLGLVLEQPVGTRVRLAILRRGKALEVWLRVGKRPAAAALGQNATPAAKRDKLELARLTPELRRRYKLKGRDGVLILRVAPDSAAARAGLRRGDLVLELDRKALRDPERLRKALRAGEALLRVQRGEASQFVLVP